MPAPNYAATGVARPLDHTDLTPSPLGAPTKRLVEEAEAVSGTPGAASGRTDVALRWSAGSATVIRAYSVIRTTNRPRSGIQRMQNANAVAKKGCICSPSKVGGEGSVRVGTPHASASTWSATVGAEARREDRQSAALFFRWFLRILTSNLESRRPTSSLTRMKVSLSRPSAFRHPWPTC
jgi:hypothetical protein